MSGIVYQTPHGHITLEPTGSGSSYVVWLNEGTAAVRKHTFGASLRNALERARSKLDEAGNIASCSCGREACAKRIARGLKPFCKTEAPAPRVEDGFSSYRAAVQFAKDAGITHDVEIVSATVGGGPKRFLFKART